MFRAKVPKGFTNVVNTGLAALRWLSEKRKVVCAWEYFAALCLDHRPVTGRNAGWYESFPASAILGGQG